MSSDTVRLIDSSGESKIRVAKKIKERLGENKANFNQNEADNITKMLGYGSEKHFYLRINPTASHVTS